MSDPVKFVVPNAVEKESGVYRAVLRDENNAVVPALALDYFTLTLYDLLTNNIVNGRSNQNALNANQVTVDAQGAVTWTWLPNDMTFLNPGRTTEEHVALFKVKWTDGSGNPRQLNHEVHFTVNRIPKV